MRWETPEMREERLNHAARASAMYGSINAPRRYRTHEQAMEKIVAAMYKRARRRAKLLTRETGREHQAALRVVEEDGKEKLQCFVFPIGDGIDGEA